MYLDPDTTLRTVEQIGRERREAAHADRVARRLRRPSRRTATVVTAGRDRPATAPPRATPVAVT